MLFHLFEKDRKSYFKKCIYIYICVYCYNTNMHKWKTIRLLDISIEMKKYMNKWRNIHFLAAGVQPTQGFQDVGGPFLPPRPLTMGPGLWLQAYAATNPFSFIYILFYIYLFIYVLIYIYIFIYIFIRFFIFAY